MTAGRPKLKGTFMGGAMIGVAVPSLTGPFPVVYPRFVTALSCAGRTADMAMRACLARCYVSA